MVVRVPATATARTAARFTQSGEQVRCGLRDGSPPPTIAGVTAAEGEDASSAREEVLLSGLVDWVALDRIHGYVAREHRGEVLSVIQEATLGLIRSLASDGLFDIGDLQGEGGRFGVWNISLDEAIQRIRNVYVNHFDDRYAWGWYCWLSLTEEGERIAESLSETSAFSTRPPTADEIRFEHRRLMAATSLIGVVADYVTDLTSFNTDSVEWLARLAIPPEWQLAHLVGGGGMQPTRAAVRGAQADGSWDASETLALFRFTGCPPADVVYENSACTLRDLRVPLGDAATSLDPPNTEVLPTSGKAGLIAVRSSGSFVFCRRWMWAQFNTYIACSEVPGQSRMLQQCLYSSKEDELAGDLTYLAETVHDAFVAAVKG